LNKKNYPYNAKSALFITSDDLNPAILMEGGSLVFNPVLALENLKKAGDLGRRHNFTISYGFVPDYVYPEAGRMATVNFLESKYESWRKELKNQVKDGTCTIFAHGRHHLPGFAAPGGGYETQKDWLYIRRIILKEFGIETFTFRSPGYQWKKSQGWSHKDYIHNLKTSGFEIVMDSAYDFYKPNDFGYTASLSEIEDSGSINWIKLIDFLNFRRFLPGKFKFNFKKKLAESKINEVENNMFYIGTYRDLDFNKGERGNALERVKLSHQRGDFIQESLLYTFFQKEEYWKILEDIALFVNSAGINKSGGIWMPRSAEEIKKWYETA